MCPVFFHLPACPIVPSVSCSPSSGPPCFCLSLVWKSLFVCFCGLWFPVPSVFLEFPVQPVSPWLDFFRFSDHLVCFVAKFGSWMLIKAWINALCPRFGLSGPHHILLLPVLPLCFVSVCLCVCLLAVCPCHLICAVVHQHDPPGHGAHCQGPERHHQRHGEDLRQTGSPCPQCWRWRGRKHRPLSRVDPLTYRRAPAQIFDQLRVCTCASFT